MFIFDKIPEYWEMWKFMERAITFMCCSLELSLFMAARGGAHNVDVATHMIPRSRDVLSHRLSAAVMA